MYINPIVIEEDYIKIIDCKYYANCILNVPHCINLNDVYPDDGNGQHDVHQFVFEDFSFPVPARKPPPEEQIQLPHKAILKS